MRANTAQNNQFPLTVQVNPVVNHRPILVCRVRSLAAALGVGTAVTLGMAGTACAETTDAPSASAPATAQSGEAGAARHTPMATNRSGASGASGVSGAPTARATRIPVTAASSAAHPTRNAKPAAGRMPRSLSATDAPAVSTTSSMAQPQMAKLSLTSPVAPATTVAPRAPGPLTTTVASPAGTPVATATARSQPDGLAVAFHNLLGEGRDGVPRVPAELVTPALALVRRGSQQGLSPSVSVAASVQTATAAVPLVRAKVTSAARGRKAVLPTLAISDASLAEGNQGTAAMAFTLTLSRASKDPVSVAYGSSNGTATAGSDYVASAGTITFAAGQISKTINIGVVGDTTVEPNEAFTVTLSKPTQATLARTVATGTVLNDDIAPPPVTGVQWGDAFFSPYVSMSNWPVPNLLQLSQAGGASLMNIGFIQADNAGNPSWGGYSALEPTSTNSQAVAINKSIADFKAANGDTMVSFGGAVGTSLSQYYSANNLGAQALADSYAHVANTYRVTHLDFDIEAAALTNKDAVALQTQAIKLLQLSNPKLQIWFTLPVTPTGLTADSVNAVTSALRAGVKLAGVNVMTMDFGEYAAPTSGPNAQTMGTYTIAAAESTYSQLSALYSQYGLTYGWSQLGVTPMIGVNDVTSEIFTLADAQALENFARTKGLGMLSMWSLLRDNPGTLGQVSDSTSGMNYPADSFSQVFDDYGTVNVVNYL